VIDHVSVVVSDRGAEIHAYDEYYGATIAGDRAAHRIVHEVAHHLGYEEPGVSALGL